MAFLFPYLFIVFLTGCFILVCRRKFEILLPAALMSSALIVYIFALFGFLVQGVWFVILISLGFPVLIIIKKNSLEYKELFFSNGFYLFSLLYVSIYVLNFDRGFNSWDEVSHWGPMVYEMTRLGKLYSVEDSMLSVHKDYPPIFPVFEYIWCFLSGGYREAYLYKALQTFSLSLFIAAFSFEKHEKSSFLICLCLAAVLLAGGLISPGHAFFYTTAYIDAPVAITAGYLIFLVFREKRFDVFYFINLGLGVSFILLTKQISLIFVLMVWVLSASFMILRRYALFRRFLKYRGLKAACKRTFSFFLHAAFFIVLMPCLFIYSWDAYVKASNFQRQFNASEISVSKFYGIIKGSQGENWQRETLRNFKEALLNKPLRERENEVSFSDKAAIAFLFFMLLYALFIYPEKPSAKICYIFSFLILSICLTFIIPDKIALRFVDLLVFIALLFCCLCMVAPDKPGVAVLGAVMTVGALIYALVLLLLYIFCFGSYEGPSLASFDRYVNSYFLFAFGAASMSFFYIVSLESDGNMKRYLYAAVIFAVMWLFLFDGLNLRIPFHYHSTTDCYRDDITKLKKHTPENARVFLVSQKSVGLEMFAFKYLASPRYFNFHYYNLGKKETKEDIHRENLSLDEVKKMLFSEKYDFVYIQKIDDEFIRSYSGLFLESPEEKCLYKIEKIGGELSLRKID